MTKEGGANANISGVFLDASPSTPAATAMATSASLVGTNTTLQGNWIGTYGTQGYDLADGQVSLPSYDANLWITGANTGTWASPTTDTRGLENAGGSGRTADYWAGGSLHDQREPDRRPGARRDPLRRRLGQGESGRAGAGDQHGHGRHPEHPDAQPRSPAANTCNSPSAATWRSR